MRRLASLLAVLAAVALAASPALAVQDEQLDCGDFEGIQCQGWFTDDAGLVDDDARVEAAIDRLVGRYDQQIAMVIVDDNRGIAPLDLAQQIGDAWGVGDPQLNDGIVVLVDTSTRQTVLATGPGISLSADEITGAGNSFFGGGDFEGGMLAIVGSLEQQLAGLESGGGVDEGGTVDDGTVDEGGTVDDGNDAGSIGGGSADEGGVRPGVVILGVVATMGALGLGAGVVAKRRNANEAERKRRRRLIDDDLASLEPAGHELFQLTDYAVTVAAPAGDVATDAVVAVLHLIDDGHSIDDGNATAVAVAHSLAVAVDTDRLVADNLMPFELRVTDERPILEEAVQVAAREALEVPASKDDLFSVRRADVQRLVESLRPHRVAAERHRLAVAVSAKLAESPFGKVTMTDAGERFLSAAPALDGSAPASASVAELDAVYRTAESKTDRLGRLYDELPESAARPAVAAALADLDTNVAGAVSRYELVRTTLEKRGAELVADGLEIPALAALLLMNNDDDDVVEFIDSYHSIRSAGFDPGAAVEYALAGLRTPAQRNLVKDEAKRLDLPVSITAALLRRRDDGPAVYESLVEELASHDVSAESRKTIAGVLAISLEPAQALRRWDEARNALGELGLVGSYADVAAAFGASDPRGPRVFALAYAAQRQALARSKVDDAERFAPELAHEGTKDGVDTWTGEPIPRGLASFDPFTLLYFHWVITRGHHGTFGWEPMYRESSWSDDRDSWWGGTGGFGGWGGGGGFSGGGGGSSSWSSGSWGGSGGFGGFGGGGGFSGGGGGGSSW